MRNDTSSLNLQKPPPAVQPGVHDRVTIDGAVSFLTCKLLSRPNTPYDPSKYTNENFKNDKKQIRDRLKKQVDRALESGELTVDDAGCVVFGRFTAWASEKINLKRYIAGIPRIWDLGSRDGITAGDEAIPTHLPDSIESSHD